MDNIDISVKVNGKSVPISTISTETFERIKSIEGKDKYERYCESHDCYGQRVTIIWYKGWRLVRVPLPVANFSWTLAAFDWVRTFLDWAGYFDYPVHGQYAPDNKALYIKIPLKGESC